MIMFILRQVASGKKDPKLIHISGENVVSLNFKEQIYGSALIN